MEQLTSLPEFWHINRDYDNHVVINNYMNNLYNNNEFFMSNDFVNNKCFNKGFGRKGNTVEITFEQFQRWVLNKNNVIEIW